MLGKAVKLAAGHLDTHSRKTVMDKTFIQQMLHESGISIDISDMTLARELWERIAEDGKKVFARTVIRHCYEHCAPLLPNGELLIILIDDDGGLFSDFIPSPAEEDSDDDWSSNESRNTVDR